MTKIKIKNPFLAEKKFSEEPMILFTREIFKKTVLTFFLSFSLNRSHGRTGSFNPQSLNFNRTISLPCLLNRLIFTVQVAVVGNDRCYYVRSYEGFTSVELIEENDIFGRKQFTIHGLFLVYCFVLSNHNIIPTFATN